MVNGTGLIRNGEAITVVGWTFVADGDNDEIEIKDDKTGETIIKMTIGDISVEGSILNGPGMGGPTTFRNARCVRRSGGCKLLIYTLL